MKNNKILILVLVVLIGAAAYLFWPGRKETAQESEMVRETLPAEELIEAPTETAGSVEVSTTELPPQNSPTQVNIPTPRDELESTDPGSVTLASGEIQLVELFAFW